MLDDLDLDLQPPGPFVGAVTMEWDADAGGYRVYVTGMAQGATHYERCMDDPTAWTAIARPLSLLDDVVAPEQTVQTDSTYRGRNAAGPGPSWRGTFTTPAAP